MDCSIQLNLNRNNFGNFTTIVNRGFKPDVTPDHACSGEDTVLPGQRGDPPLPSSPGLGHRAA